MIADNKHTPAKTCVDVFSAICILIFLACPWWMFLIGTKQNIPIAPVEVFLIDGFPFLFGMIWLGVRYLKTETGRSQFILRWRLHHIIILLTLAIPFLLMKLNWR